MSTYKNLSIPMGATGQPFSIAVGYTPKRFNTTGSAVIFVGSGGIHSLDVGVGGTPDSRIALYDDNNVTSPLNQFAKIDGAISGSHIYDVFLKTGLVISISGTTAPDVTLSVIADDPAVDV